MQSKPPQIPQKRNNQFRFGIGEWYGKSFVQLSPEERRHFASIQLLPKKEKPQQPCPFLSKTGKPVNCWKPGGICSLRSYQKSAETEEITVDPRGSSIRTTCPSRFEEENIIYSWIGEVLLNKKNAVPVGETPFLEKMPDLQNSKQASKKVGRIDNVLVVPQSDPLHWCPVEKQAVYFSGEKMQLEFEVMANVFSKELPFPIKNRRPDYRSSGPKRLLPQLEIKVPTLSTWGKKMAVVVDADFFAQLGFMKEANDISNAELAWFIVHYLEQDGKILLRPKHVFITRLKDAIEGLVAAVPLPKPKFEEAIRMKLQRLTHPA